MELDINNLDLAVGQQLTVYGKIPDDGKRFGIFLGCDPKNFAVHFNPRWDDPQDGTTIVVNSMTNSVWEHEIREANTLQRGSYVTIVIALESKTLFKIKLPSGHTIPFPNRKSMDIDYIRIKGAFQLKSFKMGEMVVESRMQVDATLKDDH
ncbi:galectin-1-like [Hypomesus transpacificus]|uniref:galectin-1-like n=1 Tax=Hypomesus transpacificus TaxID=137520 RepID=UPI001F081391|nr:galectin-1-like [Hypomesus transpacificus]XP_046907822.1 galectin-1-like [Hypomesus transpacificus]XP_046907823.1 galectin-1-like [Hypomesus transpacificus]